MDHDAEEHYAAEIARRAALLRDAGIPVGPPDPPSAVSTATPDDLAPDGRHVRDVLMEEAGIGLDFPSQSPRADRWLRDTQRLTELREKWEAVEQTGIGTMSAAEAVELRTLWATVTPVPPPKLPADYETTMRRLAELKARLDHPERLSNTVFNRLSWNFADLINHLVGKVERGEWIGDARLKGWANPPVDGSHRGVLPVDTVDRDAL